METSIEKTKSEQNTKNDNQPEITLQQERNPARFSADMESAKKIAPEKFGLMISDEELRLEIENEEKKNFWVKTLALGIVSGLAGYFAYTYFFSKKNNADAEEIYSEVTEALPNVNVDFNEAKVNKERFTK